MYKIMEYTAWKMNRIPAYGCFHLSFLIIGVVISVIIALLLKNKSIKSINKVLFGLGLFLLISEIYKQLFYTFYIGNGSYQYWIFPFQLCSIPMYLCLLLPFIKNQKIVKSMYIFLISYNFLSGFVAFLEPSGLIHDYWTLTLHAFVWHMTLVLIGLIIGLNKNNKFTIKEYKSNVLLFLLLCIIAFMINLLLRYPAKGDINMFYVGPSISPIIVFKDIATKYGWYINTIIYMLALTIGGFIFYFPFTKKRNLTKM